MWKSTVLCDVKRLQESSQDLDIEDYNLFALILTGRSLEMHKRHFGGFTGLSQLTKDDANAVLQSVTSRMDDTIAILKTLPKEMLLVFRNINTVRSIVRSHGTPINRFNIMARSAISGEFNVTGGWSRGIRDKYRTWKGRMQFDIQLL